MTAAGWIRDLAARVGAAGARMDDLAAWLGEHRDPTGLGGQLSVDEPSLPGALQASVLGRPFTGPPDVVVVQIAPEARPGLDELEAELGTGEEVSPFPAGDRLVVFPLPELRATVVARLDEDERAVEPSVRRDA